MFKGVEIDLQQFFPSLRSLVGAHGKVYIAQESMCVLRMSQEKPIEPEGEKEGERGSWTYTHKGNG